LLLASSYLTSVFCPLFSDAQRLEPISKTGFWFKIAAEPSFPAQRDFPPDQILFVGRPALRDSPSTLIRLVGHKPLVRLRRIEDLKRGTNKDIGPKDIFEMSSIFRLTHPINLVNLADPYG
jgi:hypothetical protein